MEIGYARTSTLEQTAGLEAQLRDLKAAGVKKIFSEQLSSVDAERPQLEAAIDFAREGDVLNPHAAGPEIWRSFHECRRAVSAELEPEDHAEEC
jgi:hypothetical protein